MARKLPAAGDASTVRRGLVEGQVLDHAAALFADKGFGATSLEDIATSVGMKRPSLYHYFRSKDEILAQIVARFADRGSALVLEIAGRSDSDPADKLHEIARALCTDVASSPTQFRMVLTNQANLPPELAERVEQGKRTVTRAVAQVIADGVKSGHFRAVDPRSAALAVLGMCNWTAFWFTPGPRNRVEPLADVIATMAVRSVAAARNGAGHDGDPRAILTAMRENLDVLTTLVDEMPRAQPPRGAAPSGG